MGLYAPQNMYAEQIAEKLRKSAKEGEYTLDYNPAPMHLAHLHFEYCLTSQSGNVIAEFGALHTPELDNTIVEADDLKSFKQTLKQMKKDHPESDRRVRLEAIINLENPMSKLIEDAMAPYDIIQKVTTADGKYAFYQTKAKLIEMLF